MRAGAPAAEPDRAKPARAPAQPHGRYLTARIASPTYVRDAPGGRPLHRLATRTEFGSRHVVGVVGHRGGWLKVVTSALPNRRRGWIPRRKTRLAATDYAIHVDRSRRRAVLRRGDRVVRRFRVGVGRPGNPTPLGRFAVTDKLRPQDPLSPYGCCAVALNGRQTRLEPGWPGGDRLAIHGTLYPETIGRRSSLGCLRASSGSLRVLLRRLPLGAPVFIRR